MSGLTLIAFVYVVIPLFTIAGLLLLVILLGRKLYFKIRVHMWRKKYPIVDEETFRYVLTQLQPIKHTLKELYMQIAL